MSGPFDHLCAKGEPDNTTLTDHLDHVMAATVKAAEAFGMPVELARKGAILHDIGKAHPTFQHRLTKEFERNREPIPDPFRHELASLLFLPLFDRAEWPELIEMVVAHHKSIRQDTKQYGILDLDDCYGEQAFYLHAGAWNGSRNRGLKLTKENESTHRAAWAKWSADALAVLAHYGIPTRPISFEEAQKTYFEVVDRCQEVPLGYSEWKGLLMAADHFGSALIQQTTAQTIQLFRQPDLSHYHRRTGNPIYPLSVTPHESPRPHTLVTACTGAGKTDFLLRRCTGRVFYTLPFQASINSMHERIRRDLKADNPGLDEQIRVLHAASRLVVEKGKHEEKVLQGHMGSAVKVLTPHQLASIVFGTRGYEATLMDVRGCDVILDEIHTYTQITRSIVLKIVEMLAALDCRVHIGTATMPSVLTGRIRQISGPDSVYEVNLTDGQLDSFDRHIVHKLTDYDAARPMISRAVADGRKVLIVANRVDVAQQRFQELQGDGEFANVPMLLLHSRFKRGERKGLEQRLTGQRKDAAGMDIAEFNTGDGPCIVVSTQVVEVSLDISFDLIITDTAPLDALVQRFGRVNRKRDETTLSKPYADRLKPVYVLAPPETDREAMPYELPILQASFAALPDGAPLRERDIQRLIDEVFPAVDSIEIDKEAIYTNGRWRIDKLVHHPKSVLFDKLEIDSMVCITQNDQPHYEKMGYESRMGLEIPVRYHSVAHAGLERSAKGNRPFIVPNRAYNETLGLLATYLRPDFYDNANRFI